MAFPSLSTALSNQRVASIVKAYVKTAAEVYQTVGFIRNGELKITPYSTNDTKQRNLGIDSYTFEAKFEMLQTAVGELELIDSLVDGSSDWLFKLSDAATVTSSTAYEGWVVVTDSQVGTKARYVTDGNPSTSQFIEVMIKGTLLASTMDAAVKATLETASFHISTTATETYANNNGSAGGTLFGYYTGTAADANTGITANIKANGFSSVELQDALATTYVAVGRVRNGRITCDWVAEEDSLGRYNTYAVDIDVEYELMVSDAATLLLLNTVNLTNTDVKITLVDGKVFTIASMLGLTASFENVGDFDKFRVIRFYHKGRILKSEFDGIVA
jgi:hypothetical protein